MSWVVLPAASGPGGAVHADGAAEQQLRDDDDVAGDRVDHERLGVVGTVRVGEVQRLDAASASVTAGPVGGTAGSATR